MQTIQARLRHATTQLKAHSPEPESAGFEAQLLLTHVLKVNRAWLIAHGDDVMSELDYTKFEALLARRLAGEPMAYILGEREFFGLNLKVTPDTLIPRPDTEVLVEAVLAMISQTENPTQPSFRRKSLDSDPVSQYEVSLKCRNEAIKILDLGTGTGAIALAIAKHAPNTQVTAVDYSKAALLVAQENAQNLNIHNIQFVHSDWFNALQGLRHDVIVSNPPYIEAHDAHLNQGDLRFEPLAALASGDDGLHDIRHIISHAKQYLNTNGWLLIEHGYNQSGKVASLMQEAQFNTIQHIHDLAGIARVTIARN